MTSAFIIVTICLILFDSIVDRNFAFALVSLLLYCDNNSFVLVRFHYLWGENCNKKCFLSFMSEWHWCFIGDMSVLR